MKPLRMKVLALATAVLLLTPSMASALLVGLYKNYQTDTGSPPVMRVGYGTVGAWTHPPKEGQQMHERYTWSDADNSPYYVSNMVIEWGDGTSYEWAYTDYENRIRQYGDNTVINPDGTATWHEDLSVYGENHRYSQPGQYHVVTTMTFVSAGGTVVRSLDYYVDVANVAPALSSLSLTNRVLIDSASNTKGQATLKGSVDDSGTGEALVVTVDWKDGSTTQQSVTNHTSFSLTHDYAGAGSFSPTISVSDGTDSTTGNVGTINVVDSPHVADYGPEGKVYSSSETIWSSFTLPVDDQRVGFTVTAKDSKGVVTNVPGSVSYDATTKQATFTPSSRLLFGRTYSVLSWGASSEGMKVGETSTFAPLAEATWQFTTCSYSELLAHLRQQGEIANDGLMNSLQKQIDAALKVRPTSRRVALKSLQNHLTDLVMQGQITQTAADSLYQVTQDSF